MDKKENLAVCIVANYKFLYKYFKSFNKDLRTHGNYKGELVIITGLFTPTYFFREIFFNNKVIVLRFKKIKFSKSTENQLKQLNTNGQPNRHINKNFQWHKLNLFNKKMKKWNHIFYLDINMKIHNDINYIFNLKPNNELYAKADGYPDYKWNLKSQFDNSNLKFNQLSEKYDLSINNYFQTGLLFFDTSIIESATFNQLIHLVEEFPISITNEQGILNLYFIFEKHKFVELPEKINNLYLYYYWLRQDKNTIITKQLREKYK